MVDQELSAEAIKARVPPYLGYLEGLRGLLALYVVMFHLREQLDVTYEIQGPAGALLPEHGAYLFFGNSAVAVFIVISGFVLSIPIAVRGQMSGSFISFMSKRLKRLVPAYYAAIAVSVPLYVILLRQEHIPISIGHLGGQIIAHVFFIHDLSSHTIHSINGPLWSIAVEMQIYVAFALILLPIQRKLGLVAGILAATVIGFLPTILGALRREDPYPLQGAHFWYFALFALGSSAAWVAYGKSRIPIWIKNGPWKVLCVLSFGAFLASLIPYYGMREPDIVPTPDILLGLSAASAFLSLARDEISEKRSRVAAFLSTRPLVLLGSFSYSLYLIHWPFVQLIMYEAHKLGPPQRVAVAGVVLLAMLPISYLFATVFEFPFLSAYRKTNEERLLTGSSQAVR